MKISIFTAGYCTCPEHIAIQGGRWSVIRFPAMFALFEHPRFGALLFDTGYSYRFFYETRRLPYRFYRWLTPVTLGEEHLAVNQLAAQGLRPTDITSVFISHFHADHVAALGDFPLAKYVYLPQAYDAVQGLRGFAALSRAFLPGLVPGDFTDRAAPIDISRAQPLPPELAPFAQGYDILGDESLLAVGLPGHAAGQMGLFARDEAGEMYFFVADAAWLGKGVLDNRPPAQVANLLFPDASAYRSTLASLHHLRLGNPQVKIVPSHCAETLKEVGAK